MRVWCAPNGSEEDCSSRRGAHAPGAREAVGARADARAGPGADQLLQALGAEAAGEAGEDRFSPRTGTLTVVVDSASHLYELKQLLLAGLQQQLMIACGASGLRKVALRRGRWYDGDDPAERKVRFA